VVIGPEGIKGSGFIAAYTVCTEYNRSENPDRKPSGSKCTLQHSISFGHDLKPLATQLKIHADYIEH
jgi:hypothetical protein